MRFSIKDFFSKYDQIRSFLWIWSHLLKKSLMENFCAVNAFDQIWHEDLLLKHNQNGISENLLNFYTISFMVKMLILNIPQIEILFPDCNESNERD